MKIVILCGGRGTRLGLGDLPKPMVPIDGVPLIERLVRLGVSQGFTEFVFLEGHGAGALIEYFGDGSAFGAAIEHVVEDAPLGTAGCFRIVKHLLDAPFLVIYGDVLLDVDLAFFANVATANGGAATLFVHPNDHPEDSDLVEVDEAGRIVAFHSKPHREGARYPNLVNAALYVLSPRCLDYIPDTGAADWGKDVLPQLCASESVFAYRSVEYAKDIGTPARIERGRGHWAEGRVQRLNRRRPKPAIFLDRDGVLNIERDGILRPEDVELIPGAAAAVRAANDAGIPVICVTNQPFVAKGMLTWPTLLAVNAEIDHQLARAAGAHLDDIRICPHHPQRGWEGEVPELKIACTCRKPEAGMLLDAAAFHGIDLPASWMIGDRYCDIEAGRRAGARTILVQTGHNGSDRAQFAVEPDQILADVQGAIAFILKDLK